MSPRAAWRLESLGFIDVADYVLGKADWMAAGLAVEGTNADLPRIGPAADRSVPTCGLRDDIAGIRARVGTSGLCVVINDDRVVLGLLAVSKLAEDASGPAENHMRAGPATYRPSVTFEELADNLAGSDVRRVLVTTADGKLVGLLTLPD